MQRRRITLEDGRYLVFYTFDEETASPSASGTARRRAGDEDSPANEPQEPAVEAEPQATEERGV